MTAGPDVMVPQGTGLTIERVNPLDLGDEIKQLFLEHERPEFADFFDRAYRVRSGDGPTSWVGWDEHGHVRAHIALFPRRFRFAGGVVRGALLANMMVAAGYRTFWPGLALVRQMVKDARQSGSLDFLYADPNEPARALAQVTGFRPVGALRRFVLPLGDRRSALHLGIRLYHLIRRVGRRDAALIAIERSTAETPDPSAPAPADEPGALRPIRGMALYRSRLAGYPAPGDRWFTFVPAGASGPPVGTALVRGPDARGAAVVCALEYESAAVLPSLFIALGRKLQRPGALRLEVSVMSDGPGALAARRAGFLARHDHTPLLALSFTGVGAAAVAASAEWELLPIDLDRGL